MLIYRYLSRQLFASTMAVALVLVLILVFGRFIKYLGEAAEGKIQAEVLVSLLVLRLPGFLELILPLSLFTGILLAYGRMYVDSEMTVLRASGVSNMLLVKKTVMPALVMALVVGAFSTVLTPWGFARMEIIMEEQRSRPEIDMISGGRFYKKFSGGIERTTYAESLVDNRTRLENVFMSEIPVKQDAEVDKPNIITAASGRRVRGEDGQEYLELVNGFRYEGRPGRADYHVAAFERYRVRVADSVVKPGEKQRGLPTTALAGRTDLLSVAEFQWRLSVPFMCAIAVLLGVPLSRVEPRQGRYNRLLPSMMLFLAYLMLLVGVRQWVEKGALPPELGPWWVHLLFAGIGVLLIHAEELRLWRATRRGAPA